MVEITQGEDKDITIRIDDEVTKDRINLTGLTEAKVCFTNIDGTKLNIILTAPTTAGSQLSILGNVLLGKFKLLLNDIDTVLFKVVGITTMEITLDFGTNKRKIQMLNAYQVVPAQC